jgi:hypothetical protein
MDTVVELLHEAARKFGDKPYLGGKVGDQWKTFGYKESDRLSSAFVQLKITAFSPVAP